MHEHESPISTKETATEATIDHDAKSDFFNFYFFESETCCNIGCLLTNVFHCWTEENAKSKVFDCVMKQHNHHFYFFLLFFLIAISWIAYLRGAFFIHFNGVLARKWVLNARTLWGWQINLWVIGIGWQIYQSLKYILYYGRFVLRGK